MDEVPLTQAQYNKLRRAATKARSALKELNDALKAEGYVVYAAGVRQQREAILNTMKDIKQDNGL